MALQYGFVKCKVVGEPHLKPTRRKHETQYHVHAALEDSDPDSLASR